MAHSPEMTLGGVIHSNDRNVRRLHRSGAWYGYVLSFVFQNGINGNGDPEWSRIKDDFLDIDRCSGAMAWQVKKVHTKHSREPCLYLHNFRTSYSILAPLVVRIVP
jgi:hypothetical protein